jgi:hypothetical protein
MSERSSITAWALPALIPANNPPSLKSPSRSLVSPNAFALLIVEQTEPLQMEVKS